MPSYMLDTDISSYIIKRSSPVLLQRLQDVNVSDVCISVITHSELIYGVEVSPRRQRDSAAVEPFLRLVQTVDYTADAALHYGQIRAILKAHGAMIGGNDLLIAAHARSLALTLVTNNTREFYRVPGLKLENWTQPAP